MRATIGWLIIAYFLTVSPLQAQENSLWEELIKSVRAGDKIKVTQTNMAAFQGKLIAISDDNITIEEGAPNAKTIARREVLRVNRTGHRGRNVLIGLAVGAVSGAAVGVAIRGNPDVSNIQAAAVFGLIFGGAGAGLGAAIPTNLTIYRAPGSTQVK